jgi:hypothetical protein
MNIGFSALAHPAWFAPRSYAGGRSGIATTPEIVDVPLPNCRRSVSRVTSARPTTRFDNCDIIGVASRRVASRRVASHWAALDSGSQASSASRSASSLVAPR